MRKAEKPSPSQVPQVRMYAVVVLERLPEPGEGGNYAGDPIVKAYRRLLEVERNKDVRKSILGAMPVVAGSTIKVRAMLCTGLRVSRQG